MNTLEAAARYKQAISEGKRMRVFDWDKAARILRAQGASEAYAYLEEDEDCTGGYILQNGEIIKNEYTYLASLWARPMLRINDLEDIPCYRNEEDTPGWDADTKWPESALEIFFGEKELTHETD